MFFLGAVRNQTDSSEDNLSRETPDYQKFNTNSSLRLLADLVLINLSFIFGLAISLIHNIWITKLPHDAPYYKNFVLQYFYHFTNNFLLISALTAIVFFVTGFYTFGLAYRSRQKYLLLVINILSIYGIFAAVNRLIDTYIAIAPARVPTAAIGTSLIVALVLFVGARAWTYTWSVTQRSERDIKRKLDRKVREVLVIGGGGYIGSSLLPMLLERGYKVKLLDLALFGTDPIKNVINHSNLKFIRGDFRQVDNVVEAMLDVDAVVHLGGIVGDPACALDEELTIDINLVSTRLIVEAAKALGVQRLIFASTCSVYGASDDDRLLTEDSYLNPVSLYAKSKVASEKVIHSLASDDLAPVILRFGTIFGLSGRIRFDLVVNLLVGMAHIDKKITVMGGDQWRPFVHVEDAATAVLKAVEAPLEKVAGQTFNVGGDKMNFRIRDIGDLIQKEFPDAQMIVKDNATDKRNYRVSFKHIREILEFEPKWSVQDGIKQIRDAFESGKIKDYQNPEYNNFKFLTDETNSRLISSFREWVDQFLEDTTTVTMNGGTNGHRVTAFGQPTTGEKEPGHTNK